MNTENLYPGKKVKYKDNPNCDCETCKEMKGSIVTVKSIREDKKVFLEEFESNITVVDERHIEDAVFQVPEELFKIEEG